MFHMSMLEREHRQYYKGEVPLNYNKQQQKVTEQIICHIQIKPITPGLEQKP